ncbi:probable basic-leucine zipper transcription factor E [Protopterus annectens]|uniref:probable basic-leucine zipper transcription factor E n=1 Tax=Protopterus annectens TaxID=7888 RepID=UPI001CFA723D|nr:probable basic-leucine zipper transcription factor E [Protopterus annectens]
MPAILRDDGRDKNNEGEAMGKLTMLVDLLSQRMESMIIRLDNILLSQQDQQDRITMLQSNLNKTMGADKTTLQNRRVNLNESRCGLPNDAYAVEQPQVASKETGTFNNTVIQSINIPSSRGQQTTVIVADGNVNNQVNNANMASVDPETCTNDRILIDQTNVRESSQMPNLKDWLILPIGLFKTNQITSELNATENSKAAISNLLNELDENMLKHKKLTLEIEYFQECLKAEIVPKGLRSWWYPTGLVPGSQFHKDLIHLFNQQGFQLMQTMIKHYSLTLKELGDKIEKLDSTIKQHSDFIRYKYDYLRVFHSIEQHIEKIKKTKIKKLERDRGQYDKGIAYPLPSSKQVWQNNHLDSLDLFMENNNENESRINDNNISNNHHEYQSNPSTSESSRHQDQNIAEQNPVRRSERIKSYNNINNSRAEVASGPTTFTNNNNKNKGFQKYTQRKRWNRKRNQNNRR